MNKYKCSICYSESNQIGIKNNFVIIRCNKCELEEVFNKPDNKDLSDLYAARQVKIWKDFDFKNFYKDFRDSINNPKRDQFINILKRTQKVTKKNSLNILEIGCAKGPLIDWANHNGHFAMGIESSLVISDFLRERANLDIQFIDSNDYTKLKRGNFDLIYLEHSLEHHSNLDITLKSLRKKLLENGIIHIRVPNHGSHVAINKKLEWLNYSPPHHLYFFNKRNLKYALESNNFKILDMKQSLSNSGIWLFYSLDRYINFFIRIINKFLNLKIKQLKAKNKYPESIFDYFRLIPYFIKKHKANEELLVTATRN